MCVSPSTFIMAVIKTGIFDTNCISETYFTGKEIWTSSLPDDGSKEEPYQGFVRCI